MICPLLSINFFRYQKFSGKQKGSFTKLFVSVLWDKSSDKTVMPHSSSWKFSIKEFFWSTKVFSNEIFQYSETKTPTENRDTPPPPHPYPNFFDTRNYCNNKRFPYKIFRHWDKKFSTESLDTPPPSFIQIFSGPEVSETLKDSPTKFFGTVR